MIIKSKQLTLVGGDMDNSAVNQQTKKALKSIIIAIVCVAVLVGIGFLIWSFIPKKYDRVSVQNSSELGLSGKSYADFRSELINLLEAEKYINEGDKLSDVVVREDTVNSFWTRREDGSTVRTTSFIIDIDSIKQTFEVLVFDSSEALSDMSVQITCPSLDQMKYRESECRGIYGSSNRSLGNNLPHELKLSSGEKIIVKKIDPTRDGKQLVQVYLYSCDSNTPPVDESESAVRAWVDELGDSSKDNYTYNIRTGYCEGDAI